LLQQLFELLQQFLGLLQQFLGLPRRHRDVLRPWRCSDAAGLGAAGQEGR
jgi:hypothetical protein